MIALHRDHAACGNRVWRISAGPSLDCRAQISLQIFTKFDATLQTVAGLLFQESEISLSYKTEGLSLPREAPHV
jgi:hypothetical protein